MPLITLTLRLSQKDIELLDRIALTEGTNRSALIRKGLHLLHLERRMQQHFAQKSLESGKTYPSGTYQAITGDRAS